MNTFPKIGRQLPPIWKYCIKDPPGWMPMPQIIEMLYDAQHQHLACAFMREDGIQMTADLKDYGRLQVIHMSIGPVKYYRPELNEEEWKEFLFYSSHEVAETFFPGRKFARQPDDPRKPDVIHWFSVLEAQDL